MKPSFEVHPDIEKLAAFLAERKSATYDEMSKLTGRDISGRDRHVLTGARRQLERQRGIVFATERGTGVVRASNGQVARLSTTEPIKKISRTTKRAEKRQAYVNVQLLTSDERLKFSVERSVLIAIRKSTAKSLRTRLAKEIEKQDDGIVTIDTVLSLPRHRRKD